MDVSWQSLPNEVLWRIFAAVETTSDLVQLQQVCKHWSLLAYQRLYHTASIDHIQALLPYAQTLEHSIYQPRFLVIAINLGNRFPTHRYARSKKYKRFIHTVARLCPCIVRITAGAKAPSKLFYRDVLDLHQQGLLQQLQHLPDFSHTDAHESGLNYYRLAAAMKASLTRVSIAKNPSSKLFGDGPSEMNMWEHLKAFPRLKKLDVSYSIDGFLCELDDFITKCVAPVVHIHLCLTGFSNRLLVWPLVDLDAMKPRPKVSHLSMDIFRLTAQDLEYLMCTFTGLASFSMDHQSDQRSAPLMIPSKNGDTSFLHVYLKFFRYLASLKRFKASKLWFSPCDMELFTFWAEHPQLKAITTVRLNT